MDAALTQAAGERHGIRKVALAPVIPQIIGSGFNILYNAVVIRPLLTTQALRDRFFHTVVIYNALVFPLAVGAWLWVLYSLQRSYGQLQSGGAVEERQLYAARRHVVHLPWFGSAVCAVAWLLCIPVFLVSLGSVEGPLSQQLMWHLPISFLVSAFICISQSFFLIELASQRHLFPVFFRDVRPDRLEGIYPLSLRGRGLVWAISVGICPIVALLLLGFAPAATPENPYALDLKWIELIAGCIGIGFGIFSALLISWLVAKPVDELRTAAQAVSEGRFDVTVPLRRADEFGALIGEFNRMVVELREKERLRKMFGLHVGPKAAEQILARDPGLSGREQVITVMFVDIRSFTARAADCEAGRVVLILNEFLGAMVSAVEEHHSGMINKFLGDGFMALFGAGADVEAHADDALHAARGMLASLDTLNQKLAERGESPLAIGIGLHTGPAIVGSIGSPQRLEFTAIGSTVNLASRIESLTKALGVTLLLSEATRTALRQPQSLREFPPQMVKGVADPVQVWGEAG